MYSDIYVEVPVSRITTSTMLYGASAEENRHMQAFNGLCRPLKALQRELERKQNINVNIMITSSTGSFL